MVGWHHQLNGHESEQTLEIVKNRKACHTAVHGVAESDMTEQLNNNHLLNFDAQLSQILAVGASSSWLLCLFNVPIF